ncbi:disease resistance protein Pik-2-like [Lolium perenne]|uniref:disease resistance protein Pik-2-like n=1 Tax=Lolium perenne TaxID=4522 RepID=UPI003A9967D3
MGRKVSRKRLIRRWIAEGFVSSKQGLSVEDAAEACFNQLVKRKIVRPVERNSDGTVKSCQVHDMVLEYLLSKAGEENFAAVVGGHLPMLTQNIKVRRLSRQRSDSESAKEMDSMNMSRIRSMTVFGTLDRLRFSSFKTGVVQVLDLQGCQGFKANHVMDICEMTLLKYLGLRGTDIRNLPSTIGNLKYLETLDIRDTDVQELPKPVLLLEQIRNILGGDKRTRKALKMPKEFKKGAMKNLRILSGIEITLRHSAASYLTSLTRLTKLAMYKIHTDDDMLTLLGDSIEHLGAYALQTLVVDHDSSDLFKALNNMNAPVYLSALELSGKLLQLPKWLPELNKLTKLTLSATVLQTDNLVLLSKLRSLFSLTFSIHAANQDPDIVAIMEQNKSNSGGEIFVPAGGFHNLRLLRISLRLVPSLNFCETGTPELERIELCFGRLQGLHGIHKLGNIHEVLLIVNDIPCQGTKLILDELKKTSGSHKYALIFN